MEIKIDAWRSELSGKWNWRAFVNGELSCLGQDCTTEWRAQESALQIILGQVQSGYWNTREAEDGQEN